jgi:hypothetical protein
VVYSSLPTRRLAITVTHISICLAYLDLTAFPGIRALPNLGNPDKTFQNFTNVAILRYLGAPNGNPTNDSNANIPGSQLPLTETDLHVGTQ